MSTTPQHFVHTFILVRASTLLSTRKVGVTVREWVVNTAAAVAGVVAMLPDLLDGLKGFRTGDWSLYNQFHVFAWWQVPVFPYGLHLWIDSVMHVPGGGIGALYYIVEIVLWLVCGVYIWQWIRNKENAI